MNVRIICLGKLKEQYLRDMSAEYVKRLGALCKISVVELTPERLPDVPSKNEIKAALEKEGRHFDVVILDPPAFTKSRSSVRGAQRGYREINQRGLRLVKNGGYLVTCSCSHFMDPTLFAQAIADAEAFLSSVGLDRYKADRVAFLPDKDSDAYGYCIFCVPTVAGVKGTSLWMGTWPKSDVVAPPWDYEFMRLCIDEQGVYALFWYAPLKEKETVLPSATLLPFEKIMEIFRKYVWIKEKPWLILDESIVIEQDYPSDMVVTIDRITLSLQRVMEPNSFDTALLVPVWNFWGTETTTRTDLKTRKTTEEQRNAWPPTPVLSINAIDGSVIDLLAGY